MIFIMFLLLLIIVFVMFLTKLTLTLEVGYLVAAAVATHGVVAVAEERAAGCGGLQPVVPAAQLREAPRRAWGSFKR